MDFVTSPVGRRVAIGLLSAMLPALQLAAQGGAGGGDQVAIVREALSEWAEARRTISKEREQWREGRQTLQMRMDVVRREIESLDARIADAEKSIGETEQKSGELEREQQALKDVAAVMEGRIQDLEARARKILQRVPEPLADSVRTISQLLPDGEEQASKQSLGARYLNVIGVLNAISKWNREVTVKTEVRQRADGSDVQVAVIYIGLGQAFYVGGRDRDGMPTVAGVGSSGEKGWTWRAVNELAPKIDKALSIYQNKQLAELVRLPVQIL